MRDEDDRRAPQTAERVEELRKWTGSGLGGAMLALLIYFGDDLTTAVDKLQESQSDQKLAIAEANKDILLIIRDNQNSLNSMKEDIDTNSILIKQVWPRLRNADNKLEILKREISSLCNQNKTPCEITFPQAESF